MAVAVEVEFAFEVDESPVSDLVKFVWLYEIHEVVLGWDLA